MKASIQTLYSDKYKNKYLINSIASLNGTSHQKQLAPI